ncbi:Uncharacterised protein [Raoultella ornithinolytica]|nr:Uncharacterised protein [Raoultella ornithinolytica]
MENFLPAHFVGNHQRQGVIFLCGDKRQSQTGVTRRRFNNGTAGFNLPSRFRLVDHRQRDAVFDRPAGVLVFQL